jgi:hypothetical protein
MRLLLDQLCLAPAATSAEIDQGDHLLSSVVELAKLMPILVEVLGDVAEGWATSALPRRIPGSTASGGLTYSISGEVSAKSC